MKRNLFLPIILLLIIGCGESVTTQTTDNKNSSVPVDTMFVNAKSGLKYRDVPKGELLGTFSDNLELLVLSHSNIFQEIDDDGTAVKGEWVGVALDNDTVFVFDAFLSSTRKKDIWDAFPIMRSPHTDSTSFDNITETRELTDSDIKKLQLIQAYPNLDNEMYSYRFIPAYEMKVNEDFKTIVLRVYSGDHELESILINYDSDHQFIASKVISYDEIAEGWSRDISEIVGDCITKMGALYTDEPHFDTTLFHMNIFGEIYEVDTDFRSDIRSGQKLTIGKMYTDTIEFKSYNDNGDYFYLNGEKKGERVSMIYNWEWGPDENSYGYSRGDILSVEWKIDSITIAGDGESLAFSEMAIDAKKIADGNASKFKKDYGKPLKYYSPSNEFSDYYLDYLYEIVEYYIANSNNALIKLHRKNLNEANFNYSIEDRERGEKEYTVMGISNDSGNGNTSVIQWLYFDHDTENLYEYDLANDELLQFEY